MKRTTRAKTLATMAFITTGVVIGSYGLFTGINSVIALKEISSPETVAVNYSEDIQTMSFRDSMNVKGNDQKVDSVIPVGYKKAPYNVVMAKILGDTSVSTPTSKDITKEQAAEIGAQGLWRVFGLDLTNKTIEMSYNPVRSDMPRATWFGHVKDEISGVNKIDYSFRVDAITGEIHVVAGSRTLKEKVNIGYDSKLAKAPDEYVTLAKKVAQEHELIKGDIKLEDVGQGASSNDPTIHITLSGANGEECQIQFSRYDKALLYISYDASQKLTKEWIALSTAQQDALRRRAEAEFGGPIDCGSGGGPDGSYTFDKKTSTGGVDRIVIDKNGALTRTDKIVVDGVTYTDFDKAIAAEQAYNLAN